eukprot:3519860-Pleurochrysis_carterae.AAC.2
MANSRPVRANASSPSHVPVRIHEDHSSQSAKVASSEQLAKTPSVLRPRQQMRAKFCTCPTQIAVFRMRR